MLKPAGTTLFPRVLSIVLVLVILGVVAFIIYTVADPQNKEKYTEFYILNAEGRAAEYPAELNIGEETGLILGIINRERKAESYRVEVIINNTMVNAIDPITLKHDEKFEQVITLTPDEPGDNQKVEFLLYKQGQQEVYRALHLLVNVRGKD